ncbi:hypothetical protein ACHAWF_006208 [Thalassiosira exigua]
MAASPLSSSSSSPRVVDVLWATESGRARACARRTVRLLLRAASGSGGGLVDGDGGVDGDGDGCSAEGEGRGGGAGGRSRGKVEVRGMSSLDDFGDRFFSLGGRRRRGEGAEDEEGDCPPPPPLLLLFASTTGDAEVPSTALNTWRRLLSKSLPSDAFDGVPFALFALGDRSYGPDAYCAAGRKMAARLVQLGATAACKVGYGDDGSPNGGVFADLDRWIGEELLPAAERRWGAGSGREPGPEEGPVAGPDAAEDGGLAEDSLPYEATIVSSDETSSNVQNPMSHEWQRGCFAAHYRRHFARSRPADAYRYGKCLTRTTQQAIEEKRQPVGEADDAPLLGRVIVNERITAEGWMQDTRHVRMRVAGRMNDSSGGQSASASDDGGTEALPYRAGDVATILPSNPPSLVERFLSVLPESISSAADETLSVKHRPHRSNLTLSHPWPERCTLRGLLTHCADLQSLPEREDLFALSGYCNPSHAEGNDQREKLISLSEPAGAALYGDYIIREKRNWADVLYDFDSIRYEGRGREVEDGDMGNGEVGGASNDDLTNDEETTDGLAEGEGAPLTLSALLSLLPSISPRHFSIASSPSYLKRRSSEATSAGDSEGDADGNSEGDSGADSGDGKGAEPGWDVELCVAVAKGATSRGRPYEGLCSSYLASLAPRSEGDVVRLWIRPGSFAGLPLEPSGDPTRRGSYETPVLCVGAGTGVAPLRSLILEREARRERENGASRAPDGESQSSQQADNVLVFGCRKRSADYYYGDEWDALSRSGRLRLVNAFSRDQAHKLYVQRALREADGGTDDEGGGALIARHVLERGGAIYVAGGSKMARAVREEIVEALGARLEGGERDAKRLLNRMKRRGTFAVEAWS